MEATRVATAEMQLGDTAFARACARITKLRDLVLLDRLVTCLEESGHRSRALDIHRSARDRLRRELGVPVSESMPHDHTEQ